MVVIFMNYYSIGQFAKIINRTVITVRAWDKNGKLKPHHVTKSGHRYYSDEQVNEVLKLPKIKKERKIIGYCRVSSHKQKDDLARQVDNVKAYMIAKGYSFDVITDIGSGINYKNKGLNELINLITNGEINKIVILYKDRLVRFGFELIENLCSMYGSTIEVIDQTEKTGEQELVEDLIQIITWCISGCTSCRLQGKRAHKAKKLIKELTENDTGD